MSQVLKYVFLLLFLCLVWVVGSSVWIYDRHRHEHVEHLEGKVHRKDDVVADAMQSFQRPGREKVVCYRESHRNFYIFMFQMTLAILIVTGVGVAANTRLNRRLRRTNQEVTAQKSALEMQKRATDEANAQVMASLRYASTLQSGILMGHADLEAAHPGAFLYSRPKAGIGGDFAFTAHAGGERLICVGDCTGHGAPGAILAVLAFALIRQIVEEGQTEPGSILEAFAQRFAARLGQNPHDDKAELMVAALNPADGRLRFAANGARAYWTNGRHSELIAGQGEMFLPPEGYLYFFSDGFADQIGGPESKRLLRKRFLALLDELAPQAAGRQPGTLARRLKEWQGTHVQTDDVLVLGWPMGEAKS